LALFDLDGTLTRGDTLWPYVTRFPRRKRIAHLLRVLPAVLRFVCGLSDRGAVKAAFIQALLGGESRTRIDGWSGRFVRLLLERGMRTDALEVLAGHRRNGDHLVLLSASPDLYVPAIGQALGFAEVLCTGVRWDGERLVGSLTTPNRRGSEKTRCLAALRERHPDMRIVAYGNAAGDLEHLRAADHGVLVNGPWHARRAAVAAGIERVTWR
jgi:phosphatidylglycerophosphatase C